MTQKRHVLTVFASSPGDVSTERKHVASIVEELNLLWSRFHEFHIELLQDKTHTYPAVGSYIQDAVSRQIGDSYDIHVGIMADRVGTPTPFAASGTVEEFERAFARYQSGDSDLKIMLFFRVPRFTLNNSSEGEQVSGVAAFRRRVEQLGVYYRTYRTTPEFLAYFRLSLTLALQDWLRRNKIVVAPSDLDTATSQKEVKARKYRLDEALVEITNVINRLNASVGQWNEAVQHGTPFEKILRQAAADLHTFSQDLKLLVAAFSTAYSDFLDSASRATSNLVVPYVDERRKLALTVIVIMLLGIEQKRDQVHKLLVEFYLTMGDLRASSSIFAKALADGLEAIEALLESFRDAKDGLNDTMATIQAIRDRA